MRTARSPDRRHRVLTGRLGAWSLTVVRPLKASRRLLREPARHRRTPPVAPVFGHGRGSGSPADPQPPDPLAAFFSCFDIARSPIGVSFEESEQTVREHGLFLDEPRDQWGLYGYEQWLCAAWAQGTGEGDAELRGFLLLTVTDNDYKVTDCEYFTRSLYVGRRSS